MDEYISGNFIDNEDNNEASDTQNEIITDTYEGPSNKDSKNKGSFNKGARTLGIVMLIVCIVAAGGLLGYSYARYINRNQDSEQESDLSNTGESESWHKQDSGDSGSGLIPEFSKEFDGLTYVECVEKTAPSVVVITTETISYSSFYNQYVTAGAGSGVIISSDGFILTNFHVINGVSNIKVTLPDEREFVASIVGLDEKLDIALLKIDATGLANARFGDSSALKVGQEMIVIGNPLGTLGGSVSSGIISALKRNITVEGNPMTLMQTDAAINPGNSGGGAFDAAGNLIGIVNATAADYDNLGFFIPINDVVAILDDLYDVGYVKGTPSLDMTVIAVTTATEAWYYGVNYRGLYVYSVVPDGAAAKAGLQRGDLIRKIGDASISYESDYEAAIANLKAGDKVVFTVQRGNDIQEISVTVGEYIPEQVRASRYSE